jgi:hypothetical protein
MQFKQNLNLKNKKLPWPLNYVSYAPSLVLLPPHVSMRVLISTGIKFGQNPFTVKLLGVKKAL